MYILKAEESLGLHYLHLKNSATREYNVKNIPPFPDYYLDYTFAFKWYKF